MAIMRRITEINGEIIMVETFLLKRWQIRNIIKNETVRNTDRFNGEPTWNDNVLAFGIVLKEVVKSCPSSSFYYAS